MNIAVRPARRLADVQEYYFSRKLKEVARLNAAGHDIVSLAIGCPDLPPSPATIDTLCQAVREPGAHAYQPWAHANCAKPWRASIADGSAWN